MKGEKKNRGMTMAQTNKGIIFRYSIKKLV
jgi:hypothetical protein